MSRRVGLGRHSGLDDAAGDPLDGLVNLFDLGIVLGVAFLVAGLGLAVDPGTGEVRARRPASPAPPGSKPLPDPSGAPAARGRGAPVGQVYRLSDGRLVYVERP